MGWKPSDAKFVCPQCVHDDELREFVADRATSNSCSYCQRTGSVPIAAPLDDIVDLVVRSIRSEWTDPAEELPYESREGGYQGKVYTTISLLWEEVEFPTENDQLMDDIADAMLQEAWCRRNYFSPSEGDQLFYTWQEFCELVKHERRYIFWPDEDREDPFDPPHPSEILDQIETIIFTSEIVTRFPKGSEFVRGRPHSAHLTYASAAELGPPPLDRARHANRMSPAGIAMFYGALDEETAVSEVHRLSRRKCEVVTLGHFRATRDLRLIELRALPEVPSIFSEIRRNLRPGVSFLRSFVKDLAKPIEKDGREHIEYVPTQIVTEYLRYRFHDQKGFSVDGLIYPSSLKDGGVRGHLR